MSPHLKSGPYENLQPGSLLASLYNQGIHSQTIEGLLWEGYYLTSFGCLAMQMSHQLLLNDIGLSHVLFLLQFATSSSSQPFPTYD